MSRGTGNAVLGVAALGAVAVAVIAGSGPVSVLLLGAVVMSAAWRLFDSTGRRDGEAAEAEQRVEPG